MRPSGRSALRLSTDIVCVAGQVRKVPTGDKAHPVRKKPQLRRPQKIMTENLEYLGALKGLTLWWSAWTRPKPEWNHEHCAACWAKFSDDIPDTLREGYATGRDYRLGARYEWVCEECFSKLKDQMNWSVGKCDEAGGNMQP